MFKTLVMICSLQAPDLCLTFEDTTGLKATREQCKERSTEMVQIISRMPLPIPPPYSAGYRCDSGTGEET